MVLIIALWLSFIGLEPTQVADRGAVLQPPAQPQDPAQTYHLITLSMTKEEVHQLMGKPYKSTDTLWIYIYDDGTSVEVTFSKKRRVIQVVNYKKHR